MTRIHLRYVDRFVDRHGHVRHYFRRPGGKRLPLQGMPGSNEFMAAYEAALAGGDAPAVEANARGEPGTFSRLAAQYFVSPAPSIAKTHATCVPPRH
jgi:enterobacteria phage integrase